MSASVPAAAPVVSPTTWRGLPAWRITAEGSALEAVVTAPGATLACLRRRGEELNPLWQPGWPSAPVADPAVHGDPRGEGRLLATALGSFPCVDRFGPTRADEDRPFHGESSSASWTAAGADGDGAWFTTTLPRTGLALRRCLRLVGDTCILTTSATSADGQAHDIEWCEHATIGDPFLAGAAITAGIDRIDPMDQEAGVADPSDPVLIARVLAMPAPDAAPRGDVWCGRVIDGWWRAEHPALRRRLTVTWAADDFPWLAVWTQHRERTGRPWNGRERARGLELSTKPFPTDAAWPEAVRLGRPARCTVPAQGTLTKVVRFTWE